MKRDKRQQLDKATRLGVLAMWQVLERILPAGLERGVETEVKLSRMALFVLSVGLDDYFSQSLPRLRYAQADAAALHRFARNTLGCPESQLTLITGEVSRQRITRSLNAIKTKIRSGDCLLFAFSGHGFNDAHDQYLLCHDVEPEFLRTKPADTEALRVDTLIETVALWGLDVQLICLLDACRSHLVVSAPQPEAARAYAAHQYELAVGGRGERRSISTLPAEASQSSGTAFTLQRPPIRINAAVAGQAAEENRSFGRGMLTYALEEEWREDWERIKRIEVTAAYMQRVAARMAQLEGVAPGSPLRPPELQPVDAMAVLMSRDPLDVELPVGAAGTVPIQRVPAAARLDPPIAREPSSAGSAARPTTAPKPSGVRVTQQTAKQPEKPQTPRSDVVPRAVVWQYEQELAPASFFDKTLALLRKKSKTATVFDAAAQKMKR